MMKRTDYDEEFYYLGKVALVVAVVVIITYWLNPFGVVKLMSGCSLKEVTGLYCPGCGGTRATKALLRFQILKSIYYNAAVPYAAVVYVLFMTKMFLKKHVDYFRNRFKRPGHLLVYIYIGIGILIIQWVVKLVFLLKYHIAWLK